MYIITLIRYGNDKLVKYTFLPKKAAEWCDNAFDEYQIKFCYEKLVAVGVIDTEETEIELEGREPFKSHIDKINEKVLKRVL